MNAPNIEILLIDDDEDDFVQIRDLLSEIHEAAYRVKWTSSYEEGLQALRTGNYRACLLDYRLGAQTGLDLLREAQNFEIKCPIILLTGLGDVEVDIEAMKYGAADYLVKGELTSRLLGRSIRYTVKQAFDVQNLQEQTENFKTLFNSTFEGIIVHEKHLIIDANTASGEIFGHSPSAMLGVSLNRYFRWEDWDALNKSFLSSSDQRIQLIGVNSKKGEFPVEISTRVVTLQGRTLLLTTVQDLTIRKQLEAQILQQDRLASLGLLASSLAHEIGTPLGVIRGRAELLAMKSSDAAQHDLGLIISQIDRITKLMQSVLQLARGKQTDGVTDVNLQNAINDVLQLLSHEFMQKKIQIDLQISGAPVVRGDSGPLGQVILNLLVNSIHAIEDEKKKNQDSVGRITVTAKDIDDQTLELSIHDTGSGIKKENLNQLFKPFFTTKGIGSGTGLGLAISYKIIQSWGGTIRAESRPGAGTTFFIVLRK